MMNSKVEMLSTPLQMGDPSGNKGMGNCPNITVAEEDAPGGTTFTTSPDRCRLLGKWMTRPHPSPTPSSSETRLHYAGGY